MYTELASSSEVLSPLCRLAPIILAVMLLMDNSYTIWPVASTYIRPIRPIRPVVSAYIRPIRPVASAYICGGKAM